MAYLTPVHVYLHTKYVALFPDFQPPWYWATRQVCDYSPAPHHWWETTNSLWNRDAKTVWFLCKEGGRDREVLLLSKERHKSSRIADEDKIICRCEEARSVSTELKIAQKEIFVKDKVLFDFAISGPQMQVKMIWSEIHQSS